MSARATTHIPMEEKSKRPPFFNNHNYSLLHPHTHGVAWTHHHQHSLMGPISRTRATNTRPAYFGPPFIIRPYLDFSWAHGSFLSAPFFKCSFLSLYSHILYNLYIMVIIIYKIKNKFKIYLGYCKTISLENIMTDAYLFVI